MQTPENQKETLLLKRLCADLTRDITLKHRNLILFVVISDLDYEGRFLAWGDFHARSRFARSTIPEEKWGTTRSLFRTMLE